MTVQQQTIREIPRTPVLGSRMTWMDDAGAPEPLRAAGTVVHFREGSEIFCEGEESDVFFRVVSGVVRICKFLSDGRRQIEAFHGAGDVFGFEMGSRHTLSAEAVSECTLVSYRRRGVEMLSQRDEAVTRHMYQYAMRSLAHAQDHSLLLGRRGAAEKVASFLLSWAKRSESGRVIQLAMTRQDIADYLGLTIETVSRTLSQFERDGIIALPNARQVHLNNLEALAELAA